MNEKYDILIGKHINDVHGEYHIRIMKEDGRCCVGTAEYDSRRINVETEQGIIVKIIGIG